MTVICELCGSSIRRRPLFEGVAVASQGSMSVTDVVEQIRGCSAFFESQSKLMARDAVKQSQTAMSQSLQAQIQNLQRLDPVSAAQVNEAIDASKFHDDEKSALAMAVQSKLVGGISGGGTSDSAKRGSLGQTLRGVLNYFTNDDWEVLMASATSTAQKITLIGDRLHSIGITNPSEKTCKNLVGLMACCSMPGADANTLHGLVVDMKAHMQSRSKPDLSSATLVDAPTFLVNYPDDPKLLPAHVYASAYSTSPPVSKAEMTQAWQTIVSRIPLRSNNKHLSGASTRSSGSGQNALGALLQLVQQASAADLPNLTVFQRPTAPASAAPMTPALAKHLRALPAGPQRTSTMLALHDSPQESLSSDSQTSAAALGVTSGGAAENPGVGMPVPIANTIAGGISPDAGKATAAAGDPVTADQNSSATAPAATVANGSGSAEALAAKNVDGKAKDLLAQLEIIAAGKHPVGKSKAKAKAKAKGTGKKKGGAKDNDKSSDTAAECATGPLKRPAAAECETGSLKRPAAAGKMLLGCPKCRGSHGGCLQCRDPSYTGKRYQRP